MSLTYALGSGTLELTEVEDLNLYRMQVVMGTGVGPYHVPSAMRTESVGWIPMSTSAYRQRLIVM